MEKKPITKEQALSDVKEAVKMLWDALHTHKKVAPYSKYNGILQTQLLSGRRIPKVAKWLGINLEAKTVKEFKVTSDGKGTPPPPPPKEEQPEEEQARTILATTEDKPKPKRTRKSRKKKD